MSKHNALHHAILDHQDIAAVLAQNKDKNVMDPRRLDPRRRKGNAATATIDPIKEDVALVLINHGLDINAVDIWGGTLVWYAASAGMERVVEHLLSREDLASLASSKWINGRSFTPEQEAERAGHEKIAKMLSDVLWEKEAKEGEN